MEATKIGLCRAPPISDDLRAMGVDAAAHAAAGFDRWRQRFHEEVRENS